MKLMNYSILKGGDLYMIFSTKKERSPDLSPKEKFQYV